MAQIPVYSDYQWNKNLKFLGIMLALVLLPPTSDGAMAVLMLMPFAVLMMFAAGWLFGNKGIATVIACSLLFSALLLINSLHTWFTSY